MSATPIHSKPVDTPSTSSRGGRGRGNGVRGGGREKKTPGESELPEASSQSGPRPGRKGGRRGGRGHDHGANSNPHERKASQSSAAPPVGIRPPPELGGCGSFGERPSEDAKTSLGEGKGKAEERAVDDTEVEVCFICASPVVHNSIAPCNHRTCHICALRLRALYKTRACAHCRSEAKYVIFTDDPIKRYEDFVGTDIEQTDEVLGVKYEKQEIHDDTVLLLRYNCPDVSCDIACWGWPDLHRHVKSVHHKVMCDLCTRNKKVFTHEHELFTIQELRKHEKFGDDNPGAVDQSGFKGHPECGFCRQRFYGDDELYAHCRDKHERCHICDRRNQRKQQYYVDYNALEVHFGRDHFLCADEECLAKKFVVFESEMDLKGHQLETHPDGFSKDARKNARLVDLSSFDYRTPHQEPRGGRGNQDRSRGRGRDPNTEAIPQSTAQPLRRDELAYQRQMAIQSAQSVSTRTFGGQLTSNDAYAARPVGQNVNPPTVSASRSGTTNDSFPAIDNLHLSDTSTTPSAPHSPNPRSATTPQEQARALRHNAVIGRASQLLANDSLKISIFRSRVSAYRTSDITAAVLIDTFFSLFTCSASDIGSLIKELAEIYENESRANDLLKAWNDWRAINEDYPSLPGPSGVLPGTSAAAAGSGGRRVLKLKSSTAQSSRSAVSRHGSWGNALESVSSSSSKPNSTSTPFPGLPPASSSTSSSANRKGAGNVGAVPWTSSSSTNKPSSTKPSPAPSRPPSTTFPKPTTGADAFPALPAAQKPNTTIFGLHRGAVKWDDKRRTDTPANPWIPSGSGASSNAPPSAGASDAEEVDEAATFGTTKKKGKKQTLYKFG